jgi:hypothetical protein
MSLTERLTEYVSAAFTRDLPSFLCDDVIDLPEGGGKVPLQPDYVLAKTGGEMIIRNYQGHLFRYRNPGAVQLELTVKEDHKGAPTEPQPVKVGVRNAGRLSLRP